MVDNVMDQPARNNISRSSIKDKSLQNEQVESRGVVSLEEDLSKCREECSILVEKCRKLEQERDEAREEVRGLGSEIEELQDNFKEEESEQFEQLKQELELANKNCKILQIRLAKADRQYGQLEQVKISLERQLFEWTSSQQANPSGPSRKGIELNEEDERIRDLQEQVRYSQEEAQLKGERLAAVEQENELLLTRISNLTAANSRLRVKGQTSVELDQSSLFNLESLIEQNEQLKLALEMSVADTERLRRKCNEMSKLDDASNQLETDLVSGLRKQLEVAEEELTRLKGRLVELDRENTRLQNQHKRLQEFIESCRNSSVKQRKSKLPEGATRDGMGRQELREALSQLEKENDELCMVLKMKENLDLPNDEAKSPSLKRALEEQQSINESLKHKLEELENSKNELELNRKMLDRERVSMEEEVDKLRQFNEELRNEKGELTGKIQTISNRCREYQLSCERLRVELAEAQQVSSTSGGESATNKTNDPGERRSSITLSKDVSELRVKNAFLMRQLELAREDLARELEEERKSQESQRKRAVEMAMLEVREKSLIECQSLRDELSEQSRLCRNMQLDLSRVEEDLEREREKARGFERERRRERGQLQQRLEELEGQLEMEKRASEIRMKEMDSAQRDKERELTNVQERCLQVERELKRVQTKHDSYVENSERQVKSLSGQLESKRRELAELSSANQIAEDKNYELSKRFSQERAILVETMESMKRNYEENLSELDRVGDRLSKRQEQLFQERQTSQKRIDDLGAELCKAIERQVQAKADREMLETSERRVESLRVELGRVKEERQRLRTRAAELENRCLKYEKQELATKTSSILSVKQPLFGSSRFTPSSKSTTPSINIPSNTSTADSGLPNEDANMLEKLASKIKDQRNLIDSLRARNEQLEAELRQCRLMHSIEQSKWSAKKSILTSRINDCEERLMLEASLLSGNALESIRERIQLQWDRERRQSMDTITHQQSQLESLSRDFRRLSQTHEFMKLQVRQLEDNNRKLASRLMEGERSALQPIGNHKQNWLTEQTRLINEHSRPLVNLVTKILESNEKGRRPASASSEKSNISKSSERPLIASKTTGDNAEPMAVSPTTKTSSVKRLKPKSSSLGLTVSEKQQLRQHLEGLSCTLDELEAPTSPSIQERGSSSFRALSELNTRGEAPVKSCLPNNDPSQYRASSMGRAIHWLDTSDADSEGPSSSISMAKRRLSYNAPASTETDKRNSTKFSSLTDYESEGSLISDFSSPPGGSDIGSSKVKRQKSGGLRNRFTNTLRSISRSISALTSDSESEKPTEVIRTKKKDTLKEIRV